MEKETFGQWLQKTSPSISGFNAMTVTELLYKFEKYIIENAVKGDTGLGIKDITSNYVYDLNNNTTVTLTINYTNDTNDTVSFIVKGGLRGEAGLNGNGIKSVTFVESMIVGSQTVNRYNVNYDNGYSEKINIYVENGTTITTSSIVLEYVTKSNPYLVYKLPTDFNNYKTANLLLSLFVTPTGSDTSVKISGTISMFINSTFKNGSGILCAINNTSSSGIYYANIQRMFVAGNTALGLTLSDRYGNVINSANIDNEIVRLSGIQ